MIGLKIGNIARVVNIAGRQNVESAENLVYRYKLSFVSAEIFLLHFQYTASRIPVSAIE